VAAQQPKVAIIHDWLIGGGAERVVLELHRMYPDAPIYTSYATDEWRERLDGKVVTGFLQKWPFGRLRKFLPLLRIWWFTHLDLSEYDLVISSSGNGEAKGVKTLAHTTHICYCHSPTHFYWRNYELYLRQPGFGRFDPLARLGLRLLIGPLRRWDLNASKRPDYYIANSTHIQQDIKKYYNRDATVIFPPVDTTRFKPLVDKTRHGFVIASRQVPQKKFDLAIEACNRLRLPLLVLGKGPEHERLVALGGSTVTFKEHVTDAEMETYLATAEGFLWPCFDDFGIVAVEAIAAGTPVIAYKAGGSLDYVVPGKTGLFFEHQTVESLMDVLQDFPNHSFDHVTIAQTAQSFSPHVFRERMDVFISESVSEHASVVTKI
jgi:glycosyltransferase involved in cell wall biosynthesis